MKSQGTSKAGEMDWVDEIKICNHDWVVRLIRFGDAKIPKAGFFVFDNPYIYGVVEKAIQQAIAQERERIASICDRMANEYDVCDRSGWNDGNINALRNIEQYLLYGDINGTVMNKVITNNHEDHKE